MKTVTVLCLGLCTLLLTGCTSFVANIPGMGSVIQPKDVTIGSPGLDYTAKDGSHLILQNYTSSANVAAINAQTAMIQGVVKTAVETAIKTAPLAATPAPVPTLRPPDPVADVPKLQPPLK